MGSVRRGWDSGGDRDRCGITQRNYAADSAVLRTAIPQEDDGRLIDLRDVPSRWPTMDGMVNPAPHAWRYEFSPGHLAAVDAFYRDLLWNTQLELDGVAWPGRGARTGVSVPSALRDVARLWRLPSAEEPLPSTSTARQERNARRREPKGPRLPGK